MILATPASGVAIGKLSFRGSASFGATNIDFLPAGGANGTFVVDSFTSTGSFSGFPGATGTVADLASASTFPVAPFMILPSVGAQFTFTLTSLDAGVFSAAHCFAAPAAGQTCTPPIAGAFPFDLVNTTATSFTLSLGIRGTVTDIQTNQVSQFAGMLTAQFSDMSMQGMFAAWGAGGSVSAVYSAELDVTAPG